MNDDYEWGTSNLALAAAVLSLGAEYIRTDKADTRKMVFYFRTPKDRSGLEARFGLYKFNFSNVEAEMMNETLNLNAVHFFNAIGKLKSVIHSR
jgi:hypothetical protein